MYLFNYDPITQIAFICDGATSALAFNDRYVQGVLDPFDQFGVTLVAIGNTSISLGITNVGFGASNFAFGNSIYALGLSSFAQGASLSALGISLYALGVTNSVLLGNTLSSFGSDSVDPTTVFGFLKRAQESREGNETYTKASGGLTISSRGSSQLLAIKTISDSTTSTTKT